MSARTTPRLRRRSSPRTRRPGPGLSARPVGVPSAGAASEPRYMMGFVALDALTPTVSSLRAGQEVDLVLACTRKERLVARSGSPYLALELRDRTGAASARVFRDADVASGRFERGDLVRVRARVERFRDDLSLDVLAIARADGADPAAFLPVAHRDLDELDGFLEHLIREVHDADLRGWLRAV